MKKFFSKDMTLFLGGILVLYMVGTINLFHATQAAAALDGRIMSSFMMKQLGLTLLGLLVMVMVYRLPLRVWKGRSPVKSDNPFFVWFSKKPFLNFWMLLTIALLVAVAFVGETINGATRWLYIGGISFQPSELAKIIAIIWAAVYLGEWRKQPGLQRIFVAKEKEAPSWMPNWIWKWGPIPTKPVCQILAAPMVFAALTVREDLGTSILILFTPVIMIFMGGLARGDKRGVYGMIVLAIIGFIVAILDKPYRLERIKAVWDPWQYEAGSGYQAVQSMIAVGTGGFHGMGLGGGTAKFFYLPEAHTDFAFAVWAQETGFLGCLLVILAVAAMLYGGTRIAFSCKDYFSSILVIGFVFMFGFQSLYNMLMTVGMAFVTGVPFPFISYGGTALLLNMGVVAMVMSTKRYAARPPAEDPPLMEAPSLRAETRSRFRPNR